MNCEDYQEMISAELDDELNEDTAVTLWNHLAQCATCRRWRSDQIALRRDFAAWQEERLPQEPIRTVRFAGTKAVRVYRIPRLAAWAAGIVLLAQGTYLASLLITTPTTTPAVPTANVRTVETIVLAVKDRTTYTIEDRRTSATPQPASQKNGG